MNHDISQSVSQGSNGAQDEENSRIAAIANELERLCSVHEAQCGNSQQNVSCLDAEQRAAEQMASCWDDNLCRNYKPSVIVCQEVNLYVMY